MRRALVFVVVPGLLLGASRPVQVQPPWPTGVPTFHLFFLGHEIGAEYDRHSARIVDAVAPPANADARTDTLEAFFRFVDRGTAIELRGSLELSARGSRQHLAVKGRNYRLFTSDSEVDVRGGHAHVRDLTTERDIDLEGKPFFPVDNYAPIGVQEALIQYWRAHGRPAELATAPAGPVRISSRGREVVVVAGTSVSVERLAVEGVVWGTEAAWIDDTGRLLAVTTWAGALPFEAARDGFENQIDRFIEEGVRDRIADLDAQGGRVPVAATGTFALTGVTVVDGTGRPPIADAVVVVQGGRLAAVGPASTTRVPAGARTVALDGMTVLPGLWDMHAHASQVDWAPVYLASGVTTIRDMGGEVSFLEAFRDAVASGSALGPRVLLAGLVDGPGPQAFGAVTAGTPEEGIAVTRRYHDAGFEQIKIYDYVTPDVVDAICREAHRLGMTVTGHVPRGMTAESAVEAGFDQLAHMRINGQAGSDRVRAQIAFFRAHGTVMDPTQSWNELGGHAAATPIESFLPGVARLPPPLARMFASMPGARGDPAAAHGRLLNSLRLLKEAVDADVAVVAGTDKGVPGFSLPREIELYVEGGMTPLQAIQAATSVPARVMGLGGELGTVEVGKRADLVIVRGNPLERIAAVGEARWVVTRGRLYDTAALWRAAGYRPN